MQTGRKLLRPANAVKRLTLYCSSRLLLPLILSLASPAVAQYVAPLTTADGKVACLQGMTGIGRPPRWEAIADKAAAPAGWALAETQGDATDLHFPLCVCQGPQLRDFAGTLHFMPISGTKAQTAGLLLRAQDANDYYVAAANALDGSVRLYRMAGGRRAQLAVKEIPIAAGQWHTLGLTAVADRFELALDGASLFKVTDRSLPRAGALGVWSQSDSLVHFGPLLLGPAP